MNNYLFTLLLFFTIGTTAQVKQNSSPLKINQATSDFTIQQGEERSFVFLLKKDTYYSIIAEQKGIDLVITLKDKNGKKIREMDSPNGKFGPEKIVYSPDSSDTYSLSVRPLADTVSSGGKFNVTVYEFPKTLKKFSLQQLNQDFDILKNALIETHVGLWYNTYTQFDSVCTAQKGKIKDQMTSLDFYSIVAPVVAYTKEGHAAISVSDEANSFIKQNYTYFPFVVKILEGKAYIIHDLGDLKTKGMMISKINGQSIETILQRFYTIEPADGYNITSKYHWVESSFSKYYARLYPQVKSFDIELINPETKETIRYKNVLPVSYKAYQPLATKVTDAIPNYDYNEATSFSIDPNSSTAFLTIHSFSLNSYKERRKGFKAFLEKTFHTISEQKIKNLVIDIRKNEGGEQGMEDHLLSYLINKEYIKYKYVEVPSFTYSFLNYSEYRNKPEELTEDLKSDFYRANDGRYLNRKGHYEGDSVNPANFKGNVYILISGLTFSGGSEFAALAKNYTNAKFIGEETGGGYYGNTSGTFIRYTLPNTQLTGRIPLCKFVPEVKENNIPFGHGVLPDYYIQPGIKDLLNGYDTEMEFVKRIIDQK